MCESTGRICWSSMRRNTIHSHWLSVCLLQSLTFSLATPLKPEATAQILMTVGHNAQEHTISWLGTRWGSISLQGFGTPVKVTSLGALERTLRGFRSAQFWTCDNCVMTSLILQLAASVRLHEFCPYGVAFWTCNSVEMNDTYFNHQTSR